MSLIPSEVRRIAEIEQRAKKAHNMEQRPTDIIWLISLLRREVRPTPVSWGNKADGKGMRGQEPRQVILDEIQDHGTT